MPKHFDIGIPGIPFSKEQKHAYANRCSIYNRIKLWFAAILLMEMTAKLTMEQMQCPRINAFKIDTRDNQASGKHPKQCFLFLCCMDWSHFLPKSKNKIELVQCVVVKMILKQITAIDYHHAWTITATTRNTKHVHTESQGISVQTSKARSQLT